MRRLGSKEDRAKLVQAGTTWRYRFPGRTVRPPVTIVEVFGSIQSENRAVVYLQQRPGRTKPTKVQSAIAAFLQQWQREDEHEIQAVTHEPKRHKEVSRTEFDAQCETVSRLMNRVIHLEGELSALKKELGG